MAKRLPMKIYPDPILRQKTRLLTLAEIKSPEIQALLEDMDVTMEAEKGIGLAAPQIGRSIRLAIVKTDDGILPLVNPKILKRSWKKDVSEEGCLSIPQVYGLVKRPYSITVQIQDKTGATVKFQASGLLARVIQHEVDHLDGVLFIDRTKNITSGQAVLQSMENKKNDQ